MVSAGSSIRLVRLKPQGSGSNRGPDAPPPIGARTLGTTKIFHHFGPPKFLEEKFAVFTRGRQSLSSLRARRDHDPALRMVAVAYESSERRVILLCLGRCFYYWVDVFDTERSSDQLSFVRKGLRLLGIYPCTTSFLILYCHASSTVAGVVFKGVV